MKVSNFDIIMKINFLNTFSDKKLPQKIGYAIMRNLTLLQKDYDCYSKSLEKLFDDYKEYIEKDENDQPKYHENGVPFIKKEKENDFNTELNALLNIEVDVDLFYIDEEIFNYDDAAGKYDVLAAKDILGLQEVLCQRKEDSDSETQSVEAEIVE